MKRLIFLLVFLMSIVYSNAQDMNPFVQNALVEPAPLVPVESDGTGVLSFEVGNSGTDTLFLVADQEMTL